MRTNQLTVLTSRIVSAPPYLPRVGALQDGQIIAPGEGAGIVRSAPVRLACCSQSLEIGRIDPRQIAEARNADPLTQIGQPARCVGSDIVIPPPPPVDTQASGHL